MTELSGLFLEKVNSIGKINMAFVAKSTHTTATALTGLTLGNY